MWAGGFTKAKLTSMFFPQGAICLDILGTAWSPVGTIKTALLAIRMLLESPNPKDPQDAQVAKMLIENPKLFARTAHDWAVKYAGAPRVEAIPLKYDEGSKEGSRNDASRYVAILNIPGH